MNNFPPMPQFHFEGSTEDVETFVNADIDSEKPDGPHPIALDGKPIRLWEIERMEVSYCDRMTQVPNLAARYSLQFGKNRPNAMRVYTIIFSDGETCHFAGYPSTLVSQCLEKIYLDAKR